MGVNNIIVNVPKRKANKAIVRKSIIIGPIILVLLCLLLIPLFKNDVIKNKDLVTVTLRGTNDEYLALNSTYTDLGFEVMVNGEIIDKENVTYTINHDINPHVLGEYDVNYEITYDGEKYKLYRKVTVVDKTPPVIKVDNPLVEVFECKKKDSDNLSYTASDDYDGILTNNVVVTRLEGEVVLSVSDSSGNETSVTIPIKYVEDPSKIIEMNGKDLVYLVKGKEYKDEGAKAYNGCGKEIDDKIEITNNVNINESGTYYVVYSIKDGDNVVTSKTRTVIVYDNIDKQPVKSENNEKVIYLTFDDGPGRYTEELLRILKKYNVKATFFVTNQFKDYVPLIEDIHNDGHVVAVHTLTHKWSIYSSVETYLKDFNDMNDIVYKYTGSRAKIFRFPGGSSNTVSRGYSKGVVNAIASEMTNRGYVYYDWNVDSGDASGASRDKIVENTIGGIEKKDNAVVLMHDIKKNTIDGIEEIIQYALDKGYRFDVLTIDSPTCHHRINN